MSQITAEVDFVQSPVPRSIFRPLLTAILLLMVLFVPATYAQQTNNLETYKTALKRQEQGLLIQYSNALTSLTKSYKLKGDLETFLIVEAEEKRFDVEKTVLAPADAKDAFRPAVEVYNKASAELLKQYVAALDGLVKKLVIADHIDEAVQAKAEKERAASQLKTAEGMLPIIEIKTVPKVEPVVKYPSLAGKWNQGDRVYTITQIGNTIKMKTVLNGIWARGTGTVSRTGEVKFTFIYDKRTPSADATCKGQLSEDGMTVDGYTTWADGGCPLNLSRMNKTENESSESPSEQLKDSSVEKPQEHMANEALGGNTDNSPSIPPDANSFEGHHYFHVKTVTDWSTAKARCEEMGGHLVTLETDKEFEYVGFWLIHQYYPATPGASLWIGLRRNVSTGKFDKWINGTRVKFNGWYPKQPEQNGTGMDYVLMGEFKEFGKGWKTSSNTNDSIVGYICEWDK